MQTLAAPSFGKAFRWTLALLLLSVPLLTVWNLVASAYAPTLKVAIGTPLRGVTTDDDEGSIEWSLRAFFSGDLQKAIASAVSEAIPVRPILIRLNNSFRKRLFNRYGAPGVIEGEDGQLVQEVYLAEYCSRNLATLEKEAAAWIMKLRAIQDFYEERDSRFIYIITPSKVAYMPEKFVNRASCASGERDRREYLPQYQRMLKDAGIRFVDSASLVHALRGRYEIDLFPKGGVHWNMLGTANAADAILAEINRAANAPIAPRLKWTYRVTDRPAGIDTDLYDVVNLLFARPRYPTAKVDFDDETDCDRWPVAQKKVAIIGGSFLFGLTSTLINAGCLQGLEGFHYLLRGRRQGRDYALLQRRSTADEVLPALREADIVILEENELVLPNSQHGVDFHRLLLGK